MADNWEERAGMRSQGGT